MAREDQIATAGAMYVGTNWETNIMNVLIECFIKGADWADEHPLHSTEEDKEKSPWISVDDDLPCNHEEMIQSNFTDTVLVLSNNGGPVVEVTSMCVMDGKWKWNTLATVLYWMPIPKPPKD